MPAIEINKFVGAFLMACLIILGLSFIVELIVGHPEQAEPVYLVAVPEPAAGPASEAAAEPAYSLVALLAAADPSAGAKGFRKCTVCHTEDKGGAHKIGPNLWGIVGALKARHDGFAYSDALAELRGRWTYGALDSYLLNPKDYAPGTKMAFAGIADPAARAAVIVHLRNFADEPVPLPKSEIEAQEGATKSTVEKMARAGREARRTAAEAASTVPDQAPPAASETAVAAVEAAASQPPAAASLTARIAAADPALGEKAFRKCKACHGVDQGGAHKIGPNLWDIVGAAKARHANFKYSGGMAALGGSWDYESLDRFLADPKGYAAGTKMAFPGIARDEERAAVIAYLRARSLSPAPLDPR